MRLYISRSLSLFLFFEPPFSSLALFLVAARSRRSVLLSLILSSSLSFSHKLTFLRYNSRLHERAIGEGGRYLRFVNCRCIFFLYHPFAPFEPLNNSWPEVSPFPPASTRYRVSDSSLRENTAISIYLQCKGRVRPSVRIIRVFSIIHVISNSLRDLFEIISFSLEELWKIL